MTRQIVHRWTGLILWEGEAVSSRAAVEAAVRTGADLTGADLTGADFARATLTRANLTGADLTGADFARATLTRADLIGADLTGADLTYADLTGSNLAYANLTGSNLTGSNLTGSNLAYATLTRADLTGADLGAIRRDLEAVLACAPAEVPMLLAKLRAGEINGSSYEGACACLVGTLANARGCAYSELSGVTPDANRPAERWFLGIRPGDTAERSQMTALTIQWIDAWLVASQI